ncbi:MAG: formylglycine-generating enzyme family protein [Thermoguttaceae bacterium]|nr:formylglycine-generating enzyme family protein [Thermoguttaceae bacterium]
MSEGAGFWVIVGGVVGGVAGIATTIKTGIEIWDYFSAKRKNSSELAPTSTAETARPRPGEMPDDWSGVYTAGTRRTLKAKGVDFAFRYCPAGTFWMGSPESEEGREDDETQHRVKLTRGFWMLETPVTVGMWRSFAKTTGYRMGDGYNGEGGWGVNVFGEFVQSLSFTWENPGFPESFRQTDDHPATQIDWAGAVAFCDWLAKETRMPIRLPTEAQWEYACRAGTMTPYFWGSTLNGDKANCDGILPYGTVVEGKFLARTTEVGSYYANPWGLYDMHGNVGEWCADWYDNYSVVSQFDPTGPEKGMERILRGGGWGDFAEVCRSAKRSHDKPTCRFHDCGFRLAIDQQCEE